MPLLTSLLIIFLIWILIWFLGGSFRLYASAFLDFTASPGRFGVGTINRNRPKYSFLPLRFIGMRLSDSFKDFEEELEN